MSEREPRGGERVEAVKVTEGKQTVPVGTKGTYLGDMPGIDGLHAIKWDEIITVGTDKDNLVMVKRDEFRILEKE